MPRKFTIQKDYYDDGIEIYKKKSFTIKPGLTVLVGCNGAGKTTLLHHLRTELKKLGIPCIYYDNLNEGGGDSISEQMWRGNIEFAATAMCSSEGEQIHMNICNIAKRLGKFMKTGTDPKKNPFASILHEDKENAPVSNERWFLFDAIDSGFSVDNIIDVKDNLFRVMLEDAADKGITPYILVVANEYEMARGEPCFDVQNGKYRTFKDYEDYRNFILESRELKNTRYCKSQEEQEQEYAQH